MKTSLWLKSAASALMLSLLAACGGGSDSAAPAATPLPEVAWASPAAFVTPGASSKSFKLVSGDEEGSCYRESNNEVEENSSVALYSPTLVITSSGDVSLMAASVQGSTPTVQFEMKFAELNFSSFRATGTAETPTFSMRLDQLGRSSKRLEVSNKDTYRLQIYSGGDEESYFSIECDMIDPLVLQIQPTAARVAKNLGSEAGAKTYDDYYFEGTISGEFAMWSFGNEMDSSFEMPSDSSEALGYRANLKTGELAILTNAASATYAPVSLDLPSGSQENSGQYEEGVCRQAAFFDYKEAKSLWIYRSDFNGPPISVTRYSDKFMPQEPFPLYLPCVESRFISMP